jgi:hypothetical protein
VIEELETGLDTVLLMAAAFASFGKKRRMQDPEYAAKEADRLAAKSETKYESDYGQAYADNEECNRNPRAFRRRLAKSGGAE